MKKRIDFVKALLSKEFIRFAIVGIANTLIHLTVLFILVNYFSVWYILSSFLAFLVAVTNSFILNTLWTFKKDLTEKTTSRSSQFFCISAIAAVLNLSFLYTFTEFFRLYYLFSQILAIALTLMINFIGNKFWTYR
jgi:putative flippase GtrA